MRGLLLTIVFVGLPSLAGVNYMRNAPLDAELESRPYGGIDDADLKALLSAYEGELAKAKSAAASEPTTHAFNDPSRFGHNDEKVEAFEKFQNTNEVWKRSRNQLFSEKSKLDALQHEASIRARGLHKPWPRIWRRISTF